LEKPVVKVGAENVCMGFPDFAREKILTNTTSGSPALRTVVALFKGLWRVNTV